MHANSRNSHHGCAMQELAGLEAVVVHLRGQIRGAAADEPRADRDISNAEGPQAKAIALRAQLQGAAEAAQVGARCNRDCQVRINVS